MCIYLSFFLQNKMIPRAQQHLALLLFFVSCFVSHFVNADANAKANKNTFFSKFMNKSTEKTSITSIYSFKEKTIEGKEVYFNIYKGKVLLLVNTACNCGLAKKNYEVIKKAKSSYPDLEVLLFPSALNWVVDQEKNNPEEIIKDLKDAEVYNTSTVFEKKYAMDHEPFKWVCEKAPGTLGIAKPKWNFTKFLVSKDGMQVSRFSPNSGYSDMEKILEEYSNH